MKPGLISIRETKTVVSILLVWLGIAGWVIFCLTILNDMAVLVLSFNKDYNISIGVVYGCLFGGIFAWGLIFGYYKMTRRA